MGRLLSYTFAGLLIGILTESVGNIFQIGNFPVGGFIGGLFMVALGIYIAGWWQTMAPLESLGSHLWRLIEPFGRRLMPVKKLSHAFSLGLLWGWLPCGLVYSTLRNWVLMSLYLMGVSPNKLVRYYEKTGSKGSRVIQGVKGS
jgi:hypothetical protein